MLARCVSLDFSSQFTEAMTRNSMARKTIANPDLPKPPSGKYPAKAHARNVAKWIADNGGPSSGVLYLEGQSTKMTEVRSKYFESG